MRWCVFVDRPTTISMDKYIHDVDRAGCIEIPLWSVIGGGVEGRALASGPSFGCPPSFIFRNNSADEFCSNFSAFLFLRRNNFVKKVIYIQLPFGTSDHHCSVHSFEDSDTWIIVITPFQQFQCSKHLNFILKVTCIAFLCARNAFSWHCFFVCDTDNGQPFSLSLFLFQGAIIKNNHNHNKKFIEFFVLVVLPQLLRLCGCLCGLSLHLSCCRCKRTVFSSPPFVCMGHKH